MATDDTSGLWSRVKQWLGVSVETVPADIAACEYDCRKTVCDAETLDQCERRRRAAAAETAARDANDDHGAATGAEQADRSSVVN
jgi:hypothetical protein